MNTNTNTTAAIIEQGTRFAGDDTWWITEQGCEDLGPFDDQDAARAFYAQHIGPVSDEQTLAINDECRAVKATHFRGGAPDLGDHDRDSYLDATAEATGLDTVVVAAYLDNGYVIVNA